MRALVLDLTHGGDLIALRLRSEGYEVDSVDVYDNCPEDRKRRLIENGIAVIDAPYPINYDLATLPAHCPISFMDGATADEIIDFSQAVRRLIDDGRFRIEVTGVKGKTSACYLIARMLYDAGKRVLLRSSRGEGPWTSEGHATEREASIAPPYLMTLPAGDYDVIVSEVSLGGSGKADIACITNLVDDYGIAKNTLKASYAKKDVFSDGINIVPEDEIQFWSQWCGNLTGYRNRITPLTKPRLGEGLRVSVEYDGISEIVLNSGYIASQYFEAMSLALEVCKAIGIEKQSVLNTLSAFGGVPGRGEIREEEGRTVILERNPGISALSVARTMKCLDEMNALENAMAIVDPVNRKVCEKMDAEEIRTIMEEYGVPMIVTEGDGVFPTVPDGTELLIVFVKEAYR